MIGREIHAIISRADWLRLRQADITASRVAALFDCHPFMSRDELAASLRGESKGDNPAMRAGRILEPAVLEALAEDHPDWRIVRPREYVRLPDLRFGATPDAYLDDDALIQVKTASPEEWDRWQGNPPLAYKLQTLTELIVTGRVRGVLAVMVRSRSFPVYEFDIPRHKAAEARILDAVEAWWRYWDLSPPSIAVAADVSGLAEALDDGSVIDLRADNELPALLVERAELKASAKRLDEIDAAIKAKMGIARLGILPGFQIKYPTIHAKEYTVAARDYRRLTITQTEEN